ncbi:MAG: triose-phosphate isomerase, partial [Verrucomicrobia bacterium]|nr:triose-phosphate isomerase [Verrucomicrobiota bacterium]
MTALFGTNWKMRNVDHATARAYARTIAEAIPQLAGVTIFILPPVTLIREMARAHAGDRILIGAQNVHWAPEG